MKNLKEIRGYTFLLLFLFLMEPSSLFSQEVIKEETKPQKEKLFAKHHFYFSFGRGMRTASLAEGADNISANHYKGLKNGWTLHGNFAFYPSPNFGPSAKYSQFFSSHSGFDIDSESSITFAGAGVSSRAFVGPKVLLYADFHLGYVHYKEVAAPSNSILSVEITGDTIGLDGSASINFLISPTVSIQLQIGYQEAALRKIKDKSGQTHDLEEPSSLNRLDFNTGIKLHL